MSKFYFDKKARNKALMLCFFLGMLLIMDEAICFEFFPRESLLWQWQKNNYRSAIKKGIGYYSVEKTTNMRIDDYFLFKQIANKENLVSDFDDAQYAKDPFRRLLDKSNPLSNLIFTQAKDRKYTSKNFSYDIVCASEDFLVDLTDDIVAKALYCDVSGYSADDFLVLQSMYRKDGSYFDTHYLLSLLFLKNNHCYDEKIINAEIQKVVDEIVVSEKTDENFSDLFAERVVFLYWAGYGERVEGDWIGKIKSAQNENGYWHDAKNNVTDAHTTGLSILAMIYYLEGENRQSFY